jgi:hypothetical protein
MAVVEESQGYILRMLNDLETELAQFAGSYTPAAGQRVLLDEAGNGGQGLKARNSERLFGRLDSLCGEMKENDRLVSDAMRKMQQIEIMKAE